MNHRRAFLQAIIEAPEDDAPRLVFADWLDDQGDAGRAEFVRAQCALARLDADDPRRPELCRREDELLAAHQTQWLRQDLPAWARPEAVFRRGFVCHVAGHVRSFAQRGAALFARAPITSVKILRSHPDDVDRLAAIPQFAGLQHLHLYDPYAESFERLLDVPFLPQLRGLTLSAWSRSLDVDDVAVLIDSVVPARLIDLDLDSFRLDVAGFQRLVRSEVAGRLERLRPDGGMDREMPELAAEGFLSNLRTLDLRGNCLLTDEGMQVIAASATFAGLRRLNLSGLFSVTDAGVKALAESPYLRQLEEVVVCGARVTDVGIEALVQSPHLPRLCRIDVEGNSTVTDRWPFWRPSLDRTRRVLWVHAVRG
jgi:uncharacterized protein (TIGR02996 family)